MWITFIRDYSIILASQETKIYHKDLTMNCRNEEKARKLIERGYAKEAPHAR